MRVASCASSAEDRFGFRGLRCLARDCLQALLREPRDAAVLASGSIGELAQASRSLHPFGRGLARFGVTSGKRQFYQQRFVGYAADRLAPALRVVGCVEPIAERVSDSGAHCGIRFGLPRRGQLGDVAATARGGNAHFRRGIARQQAREFLGIRLQCGGGESALRGFGVLVLRRA